MHDFSIFPRRRRSTGRGSSRPRSQPPAARRGSRSRTRPPPSSADAREEQAREAAGAELHEAVPVPELVEHRAVRVAAPAARVLRRDPAVGESEAAEARAEVRVTEDLDRSLVRREGSVLELARAHHRARADAGRCGSRSIGLASITTTPLDLEQPGFGAPRREAAGPRGRGAVAGRDRRSISDPRPSYGRSRHGFSLRHDRSRLHAERMAGPRRGSGAPAHSYDGPSKAAPAGSLQKFARRRDLKAHAPPRPRSGGASSRRPRAAPPARAAAAGAGPDAVPCAGSPAHPGSTRCEREAARAGSASDGRGCVDLRIDDYFCQSARFTLTNAWIPDEPESLRGGRRRALLRLRLRVPEVCSTQGRCACSRSSRKATQGPRATSTGVERAHRPGVHEQHLRHAQPQPEQGPTPSPAQALRLIRDPRVREREAGALAEIVVDPEVDAAPAVRCPEGQLERRHDRPALRDVLAPHLQDDRLVVPAEEREGAPGRVPLVGVVQDDRPAEVLEIQVRLRADDAGCRELRLVLGIGEVRVDVALVELERPPLLLRVGDGHGGHVPAEGGKGPLPPVAVREAALAARRDGSEDGPGEEVRREGEDADGEAPEGHAGKILAC